MGETQKFKSHKTTHKPTHETIKKKKKKRRIQIVMQTSHFLKHHSQAAYVIYFNYFAKFEFLLLYVW